MKRSEEKEGFKMQEVLNEEKSACGVSELSCHVPSTCNVTHAR
jgi:hypothetical protein